MLQTIHTERINGLVISVPNRISDTAPVQTIEMNEFEFAMFNHRHTSPKWQKDNFYISYNNWDISSYGCDTTALVWGQMQYFFILNGDHRVQYAALNAQGFEACFKYFNDNKDKWSKYSERDCKKMRLEIILAHPIEKWNWNGTRICSAVC